MSGRLVVSVAGERYALAVAHVLEVVERDALTPVPGSAGEILGVRNVRGRILPVLDLALLLGHGPIERTGAHVVVEAGPVRVALAVEAALDLVDGADRSIAGAGGTGEAVVLDGVPVGVVDVGRLLGDVAAKVAA